MKRRITRLSLLLGGLLGALLVSASAQAGPLLTAEAPAVPHRPVQVSPVLESGVYFYGSAPEPDVIGASYMVFAAEDTQVVGALFMPHSSFDCFQGQVRGQELALQITNSYTQEVYNHAIALVSTEAPVAANGTPEVPMRLAGFFDLGQPRTSELDILATCQQDLSISAEMEL